MFDRNLIPSGVGMSEGLPLTGEDLIQDGVAAMLHLLEQGVRSQNVLIHGFSMGGGTFKKNSHF